MIRMVEIQNVGPIEKLSIPLPASGVVVLRGRNGVGKSHALAAVDSLISGRGKPPCRDGAEKGLVEGFGARLTIGRSQRRTGEAEVVTLEGRLDISQLVQPPLKDEEAADRQRIKALVQLSGQSADLNAFAKILPPGMKLDELVPPSERSEDPVVLAGQLKRALEAEARRVEKQLQSLQVDLAAMEQLITEPPQPGIPEVQEETIAQAKAAYIEAQKAEAALRVRAEEVEKRRQQAEKAKSVLASLQADLEKQNVETLQTQEKELAEQISKLEKALAVARERLNQVQQQLQKARQVQSQVEQLKRVIAETPEPILQADLDAASQAVEKARQNLERLESLRRNQQLAAEAKQLAEKIRRGEAVAALVRDAARSTDQVLSEMVSQVTSRLRVEGGRLVCDTDRGVEPFGELSPGERWRIALEVAAQQVGQGGLVTVPQEAWEALDPVNRAEIAQIARQVGVVILTAEADAAETIQAEILK
jgi:DNA repair ATPase RecN